MTIGSAAGAASVVNGSFELPVFDSTRFDTYAIGSTSLVGWDISGANLDHIGKNFWQASDGVNSVDLNGSQGASTISQMLSGLVVGQTYKVLFDMAANPDNPSGDNTPVKTMQVSVGADSASYSFDKTGKTRDNMGWEANSFTFVAGATDSLLSFASTSAGRFYGPALDNVRLSAVPLPAGGLLLIGALGGLAFLRRRKAA
jgi:choice-of-anchor C domain-containing protein